MNVALRNSLKDVNLTGGATDKIGGVSADQEKAFADLAPALLAAIVIVFSIMVATFRTFVQPRILLISIPFAATGAFDAAHLVLVPTLYTMVENVKQRARRGRDAGRHPAPRPEQVPVTV